MIKFNRFGMAALAGAAKGRMISRKRMAWKRTEVDERVL
jgi:hypothetical protein